MAPSAIAIDYNEITVIDDSRVNLTDHNHGEGKIDLVDTNHVDSDVTGFASKALIQKVMKEHIARIDVDSCEPGEEDAFYVADLGEVYRQHLRWKTNLARVKPFYAVKCNPDPEVLRLLASLGTGFDCASVDEINRVLSLGVSPTRIIYANPCKHMSYLRYAAKVGVTKMTFDNETELFKIKRHHPGAELVLRILTDDSASLCQFSQKFGASLAKAESLLALAHDLHLNVIGVSFHVGSGASDPQAFAKAVKDARYVFDLAAAFGYDLTLLDVGGGFQDTTFEVFAGNLRDAIEEHFPPHIKVIAEPGRYYVANAFTLATNVIARREVKRGAGESGYMLYLNDGVYGNFSNIIFDHQHPVPKILSAAAGGEKTVEYSIWGPTCDGIDVITDRYFLPGVLDIGDWLLFENMGAYTKCSATEFNGFTNKHAVIYISSEPGASALLGY